MRFNSNAAGRGSAENTLLLDGPLGQREKPFPISPLAKSLHSHVFGAAKATQRSTCGAGRRAVEKLQPTVVTLSWHHCPEPHPAIRAPVHTHTHTQSEAFGGGCVQRGDNWQQHRSFLAGSCPSRSSWINHPPKPPAPGLPCSWDDIFQDDLTFRMLPHCLLLSSFLQHVLDLWLGRALNINNCHQLRLI